LLSLLLSQMALAQTEPRLGVNTTDPQHTLDVNGAINIAPDSAYQINGIPVLQTQVVNGFTNFYLGPEAGLNNTTGNRNHFSGYQAGLNNTTGVRNYFSGFEAGKNNTTGLLNHFSGYQAGQKNTTGGYNHFSGYRAGAANTTGGYNHFSGYEAGRSNTTGDRNYFSGFLAGEKNTTGEFNHFVGYLAGTANTTGNGNYFSGYQAGRNTTTGNNNHFSGYEAGFWNTTGSENVYIGYQAGAFFSFTNAIAIGYQARVRGDNTVTIGNSSHTSIGGYQPWSNLSDGRFKREVAEDVPGLDFVTRLRPVSYRVDWAALQAFLKGEEIENGKTAQDQPRETGFIAQEVEEVSQALGYQFNGIIQPQSENDHYQLSYATFVVPLVQAVQEQQELIEALQAENARLSQTQQHKDHEQQIQIEALQAENSHLIQQNTHNQAYFKQLESRLQALEGNQPTVATQLPTKQ
ncbi:MAG: tail fiber domain-containing protein, partial [Bacteroidota bacterium]